MDIKKTDFEYVMNTYARQDIVPVSGKGVVAADENGKEYIDLSSGIGVNSLGYCDDAWCKAVIEQVNTLQHTSNYYSNAQASRLAKRLCEETGYSKVFFGNSGAEANEGAIKLARKYSIDKYNPERNKIVTLQNSFHGRTITTLAATGQDSFHQSFFPLTEGFLYSPANDIDRLNTLLVEDKSICAVMVEFIQGEGGVVPLEPDFVSSLFERCKKLDILVVADEVQTGIGRTGKLLASEHYKVSPDITTLAKGLGGGLPIGAVLANEKTAKVLAVGDHGSTFGGNPVVCAGANAVLDRVASSEFLSEVAKKGEYIRKELSGLAQIEGIDGMGLMLGIRLKTKKSGEVLKACIEKGCMPLTAKEKLRLLPPLTISYDELKRGLDIIKEVLAQ